ncbi:hypothetical protein N9U05_00255 [bacterium]|nr:hypothetical protein [bacterium]MDA9686902.1 hypothetical protein [bacterium]
MTDVPEGSSVKKPSLLPAYTQISQNMIISNYGAGFGVDNDDTSSYYKIYSNFFYLGGGVKCDYDGHEKHFYENVMLGTTASCWHTCAYKKGYTDHCYNNTVIQTKGRKGETPPAYAIIWFCNKTHPAVILPDYGNEMLPVIHSNRVYNSNGTEAFVDCGYSGSNNNVPLKLFMDAGLMQHTEVHPLPTDEQAVQWGREVLGMATGLATQWHGGTAQARTEQWAVDSGSKGGN